MMNPSEKSTVHEKTAQEGIQNIEQKVSEYRHNHVNDENVQKRMMKYIKSLIVSTQMK